MPDPAPFQTIDWEQIGNMLISLWIVVVLIVVFAANMILGHIMIPSLVASRHISSGFQKVRPVFYLMAIAAFGFAMYFLARTVDQAGVIRDFFPNYWL